MPYKPGHKKRKSMSKGRKARKSYAKGRRVTGRR
mgnify:CR=1 FL=1